MLKSPLPKDAEDSTPQRFRSPEMLEAAEETPENINNPRVFPAPTKSSEEQWPYDTLYSRTSTRVSNHTKDEVGTLGLCLTNCPNIYTSSEEKVESFDMLKWKNGE